MPADQLLPDDLLVSGARAIEALRQRRATVSTVESCTGGLLSAVLTSVPGASDVFGYGFVTYANAAKTDLVGVPQQLLNRCGAVSVEVAVSMAEGARLRSASTLAVAITGVAGPGGGSADKPVGLVFLALSQADTPPRTQRLDLGETGRASIRLKAVAAALDLIYDACRNG